MYMYNNFGIEFRYIYSNYNPFSNNYDERGVGVHYINGRFYAVVLRTYYDF